MENLDEFELKKKDFPVRTRNKIILYISILMILNIIIVTLSDGSGAKHLDGTEVSGDEFWIAAIKTTLIGIPIFGFMLGSVVSFIPYKDLTYRRKYVPFSLIITLVLQSIMFLAGLKKVI